MSKDISKQFVDALAVLEREAEVTEMLSLFNEESTLWSISMDKPVKGLAGAKEFWIRYRNTFSLVRSDFSKVSHAGECIILEWISSGNLKEGADISCRGVSIIEVEFEKIKSFKTYYDTAALSVLVNSSLR